MKASGLLAALLLAASPVWAKPRPAVSKEAAMEWKSPFCGVTAPGTRVVQSAEDWKKLWAEIGRPAPDVELAGKAAVAVFLGERPTGGFGVSFLEPVPEKKVLRVRYKISTPKGMMVIQALTQPYGVKLLPGTTLEIKVEEAR